MKSDLDEGSEQVTYPDDESKEAVAKAMALLLHKDRTEKELADRLYRAGFSEKSALFAIEYVKSFGYINDARYAETYIDYHKSSKSKNEIKRKLIEKGISEEYVDEAFRTCYEERSSDDADKDPEEEALLKLINKRIKDRDISDLTYEEKMKQMRYLSGKGYPTDKIQRAFNDR